MTVTEPTEPIIDDPVEPEVAADPTDLVEEEVLVEEISIDGMCGVY